MAETYVDGGNVTQHQIHPKTIHSTGRKTKREINSIQRKCNHCSMLTHGVRGISRSLDIEQGPPGQLETPKTNLATTRNTNTSDI